MNFDKFEIWLIWGLVPYHIRKQYLPKGVCQIEIHALFWTCAIKQRPNGRHDWAVRVALINKLRQAIWAAVIKFKDGN